MSKKELIKEFITTYCPNCSGYAFCGGECMCVYFEKIMKDKTDEKKD